MMELRDVVRARHSVRDFRPDPVPREVLERIVDAARLAPSSMNAQPWTFYVLTGRRAPVHRRDRRADDDPPLGVHGVLGPERYEDAVQWYSSLGDAPVLIAVACPSGRRASSTCMQRVPLGRRRAREPAARRRRRGTRRLQHHVLVLGRATRSAELSAAARAAKSSRSSPSATRRARRLPPQPRRPMTRGVA